MNARWITQLLNRRLPLLCIIIFVLACGFLYCRHLGESLRYPDERQYLQLAQNLNAEAGYTLDGVKPTAFRPPGYPALLYIVLSLGGHIGAARAVNLVCLAISLVLLFRLTERQGGTAAGTIAVALAALYPVNLYTAGTLYPQTPASTLLLFLLWLFLDEHPLTWSRSLLLGAGLGLAILLTPAFVFVAAILCLIACGLRKERPTKVAAILLAMLVMLAPWHLRNFKQFNAFVFVSTNSGINLLLGNSENTGPNDGVNVDIERYREAARGLGEVERNAYYTREAIRFIREHPGRAMGLYLGKFANYFNFRNTLHTKSEASRVKDLLMLASYGPLLILVIIRLCRIRSVPLSPCEQALLIIYVLNAAFAAIFFTRIRFRIPFDFVLVSLAAMQLARWLPGGGSSERDAHAQPGR